MPCENDLKTRQIGKDLGAHPSNDWDPAKALLESDVHVAVNVVRTHEICEAPCIPPVGVDLELMKWKWGRRWQEHTWWLAINTNFVGKFNATGFPSLSLMRQRSISSGVKRPIPWVSNVTTSFVGANHWDMRTEDIRLRRGESTGK
jgi:hypothetical protein